jgi:hypothetical protein
MNAFEGKHHGQGIQFAIALQLWAQQKDDFVEVESISSLAKQVGTNEQMTDPVQTA